jgi:hypothetical protein
MENLTTKEALLSALRLASERQITETEMRAQRISFVMGSLGQENNATRAKVERVLAEQDGR